jgi:hypothetical protein
MLRLLLRADPTINPDELHRLKYIEKRLALFLVFSAVSSSSKYVIWRRLRVEDEYLLRHILTFL